MRLTIRAISGLLAVVTGPGVSCALAESDWVAALLKGDVQASSKALADSADGDASVVQEVIPASDLIGLAFGLGVDGAMAGVECAPAFGVGTDPEGDSPSSVRFLPDGSAFVVSHRDSRNLLVYDADTRDLLMEIPLSGSPDDLDVSPDGTTAVTANIIEDTASIVDLVGGTEVAVVGVGDGPAVARITPDGTRALIGNVASGDATVIDLGSNTVDKTIGGLSWAVTLSANFEIFAVTSFASNPFELADNTMAVFPDFFNDQVLFIDIDAGTVTAVASADQPRRVAITPDGATAVVSHTGSQALVSVVDVAGESITKTINTIDTPFGGGLSISPDGTRAAVSVLNATRVVDLVTDTVGPSLGTASINQYITTADGQFALGVGFNGPLISYASQSIVKFLNQAVSTTFGAVSPVEPRAVMFSTTFGWDMVVVNTDGAAGFLEEFRPSGPPPEGDKPRTIAVTKDGSTVGAVCQFSDTVAFFDNAGTLQGYGDVGMRPGEIEFTSDGSKAVVANRDDSFLSVIDVATLSTTNVPISTRGDQVEISPDDQFAYVGVVSSGDGVWRVNLDTLSVQGPKLFTGEMGGVGYVASQFSGMALSNDGSTLITCNSFDNTVTVIDAAAWQVVATVAVGAFPTRAAFLPDDSRFYVVNRDGDNVTVVDNAGAGSGVVATIGVGDFPYEILASSDGARVYVLNASSDTVSVIDTNSLSVVDTVAFPSDPTDIRLSADGSRLFVSTGTASASTAGGLTLTQDGQVEIVDTSTNTIVETICTERWNAALGSDDAGDLLATANLGDESISLVGAVVGCPADFNGDGDANVLDFVAFQQAFAAMNPAADCNDDGEFNILDFVCFQAVFAAGCP